MILEVPSQSKPGEVYYVDVIHRTCTCIGYVTHNKECKHLKLVDDLNVAGELSFTVHRHHNKHPAT